MRWSRRLIDASSSSSSSREGGPDQLKEEGEKEKEEEEEGRQEDTCLIWERGRVVAEGQRKEEVVGLGLEEEALEGLYNGMMIGCGGWCDGLWLGACRWSACRIGLARTHGGIGIRWHFKSHIASFWRRVGFAPCGLRLCWST
eukprot:evm.model.NODE_35910_length_31206_cov_30.028553.8